MIDHVSVPVHDLETAGRFYETVLGCLGFVALEVRPRTVGFGKEYPEFWINLRQALVHAPEDCGAHVCFRARSPEMVDAFHKAALAVGGTSDGVPGLRPQHGEGYYSAFVRDLDGNRIEAVSFLTS